MAPHARSPVALAGWAAAGLVAGGCAPEPSGAPAARGPVPGLSILTYNVNFEQFSARTLAAIAEARADVVFLQEVTPGFEPALRAALAAEYATVLVRPASNEGGMAVLSRFPVEEVAVMDSPVGRFPAWCLRVDTPLGPIDALHAHLHPPLDENGLLTCYFTTSEARAAEVEAYLGCFGGAPDLVLGDLNEEAGAAVDRIVAAGLRDAASAFPPPRRTWTWPTPLGELEGRPDHVFVGPGWRAREVAVLESGGSDHGPLRVVLGRAP